MTSEKVKQAVHSPAGQAFLKKVVSIAQEIGKAVQKNPSATTVTVQGRVYHTRPGGMCDREAREIQEGAMGIPDHSWEFAAGSAKETEAKLKAAGRQISGYIPGAVGCFDDGTVGHIITYIGGGNALENTSSDKRGNPSRPGTKITSLTEVFAAHGGATGRWYYAGPLK